MIRPPGTNVPTVGCDLEAITMSIVVAAVARICSIRSTHDVSGAAPNTLAVGMAAANVHISPGSNIVLQTVAIEPKV